MTDITKLAQLELEMKEWRHYLHSHPETAFQEHNTAAYITQRLESFGLKVHTGIGGTGLVASLNRGIKPVKSIGLRADMDALDIHEESEIDYKSTVPRKMHACGHDGHSAMLLGAAKYLASNDNFHGTVHLFFSRLRKTRAVAEPWWRMDCFNASPWTPFSACTAFQYCRREVLLYGQDP